MIKFLQHPIGCSLAAILATFLWGSAFPFVKIGYKLAHIQRNAIFLQIEFAGYRFVIAACILIVLSLLFNRYSFSFCRKQLLFIVLLGFLQTFLQYLFFYIGIALNSGITSSLIAGTLAFFQLGLAHLMYRDSDISCSKIIAALLGFTGIFFYLSGGNSTNIQWGVCSAFMFAAMFFAALGNVLYRQAPHFHLAPLPLTAAQMFLGGLGLILVGGIREGFAPFPMESGLLLNLLYLAGISSMSFFLWNSIMTYNKASNVSVFLFLIPLFGVILSALILHEPLRWRILPSLLLVCISIVITVSAKSHRVRIRLPSFRQS